MGDTRKRGTSNSHKSEPGRNEGSALKTGDKPAEHSTKRASGMKSRGGEDKPKQRESKSRHVADTTTTNAASRDQAPKSRAHEPGVHEGSSMGTGHQGYDSFSADRTAGVDSMGHPRTEPEVLGSGLNHTSHDGSRSTDAGRTAKMNDRGGWDEPKQHSATTTATGHRASHPGVDPKKKTAKMASRSDADAPKSY